MINIGNLDDLNEVGELNIYFSPKRWYIEGMTIEMYCLLSAVYIESNFLSRIFWIAGLFIA